MIVHRHRCTRCGYVWQCVESNRSQPEHDICAICEALDRMRTELPGTVATQGLERDTRRQVGTGGQWTSHA
jgi:hypothetical protein